eukprot:scaffold409902_cov18-Prasinocladus_malaysianus.AAC.1
MQWYLEEPNLGNCCHMDSLTCTDGSVALPRALAFLKPEPGQGKSPSEVAERLQEALSISQTGQSILALQLVATDAEVALSVLALLQQKKCRRPAEPLCCTLCQTATTALVRMAQCASPWLLQALCRCA